MGTDEMRGQMADAQGGGVEMTNRMQQVESLLLDAIMDFNLTAAEVRTPCDFLKHTAIL
jgi:hypothetical protein